MLRWSLANKAIIFLVCLSVAIVSSYKLLAVPDLKPGDLAPFDAIAPKDAQVIDSAELQQKRSDLIPLTSVQVIDEEATKDLNKQIRDKIIELELLAESEDFNQIGPINLTSNEKFWIKSQTKELRNKWGEAIIQVSERILRQGLVKNLAKDQLRSSAYFQLSNTTYALPAKTLGRKLIANTFYGKSNLRLDPRRSQQLLEELITKQGVPIINVKEGNRITRKGDFVSQKTYDVLDYFGMINRSPRPIEWFWSFGEAFSSCIVLLDLWNVTFSSGWLT